MAMSVFDPARSLDHAREYVLLSVRIAIENLSAIMSPIKGAALPK
jgi:hypothetical protein